jgi:hypothetical protein
VAETTDWEQGDDEPANWYGRFYDHFLPLGPERNLDHAYRSFCEKAPEGPRRPRRATSYRAPGAWKKAAAEYAWYSRARSWDEEQRRAERQIERQAHQDAVKKANERHQNLVKSRFNAMARVVLSPDRQAKWDQMSVSEERQWMLTLIQTDRMLLSQPLLADDSRVVPAGQYTSHGNPAEHTTAPHQDRFSIADGELVSAFLELERREFVPEPTMEVETDAESCDREGPIRADQAGALAPQEEREIHPAEPGLPEVQPEANGVPSP